jgi:hypothetical protein
MKQTPSTGFVCGGGEAMVQGNQAPPVILQDQKAILEFVQDQTRESLEHKRAAYGYIQLEAWGNDGGDMMHA